MQFYFLIFCSLNVYWFSSSRKKILTNSETPLYFELCEAFGVNTFSSFSRWTNSPSAFSFNAERQTTPLTPLRSVELKNSCHAWFFISKEGGHARKI